MHTGYDEEFVKLKLISLVFNADGEFVNKGVYGDLKQAKTDHPDSYAVMAALKAWSLNFMSQNVTQVKLTDATKEKAKQDKLADMKAVWQSWANFDLRKFIPIARDIIADSGVIDVYNIALTGYKNQLHLTDTDVAPYYIDVKKMSINIAYSYGRSYTISKFSESGRFDSIRIKINANTAEKTGTEVVFDISIVYGSGKATVNDRAKYMATMEKPDLEEFKEIFKEMWLEGRRGGITSDSAKYAERDMASAFYKNQVPIWYEKFYNAAESAKTEIEKLEKTTVISIDRNIIKKVFGGELIMPKVVLGYSGDSNYSSKAPALTMPLDEYIEAFPSLSASDSTKLNFLSNYPREVVGKHSSDFSRADIVFDLDPEGLLPFDRSKYILIKTGSRLTAEYLQDDPVTGLSYPNTTEPYYDHFDNLKIEPKLPITSEMLKSLNDGYQAIQDMAGFILPLRETRPELFAFRGERARFYYYTPSDNCYEVACQDVYDSTSRSSHDKYKLFFKGGSSSADWTELDTTEFSLPDDADLVAVVVSDFYEHNIHSIVGGYRSSTVHYSFDKDVSQQVYEKMGLNIFGKSDSDFFLTNSSHKDVTEAEALKDRHNFYVSPDINAWSIYSSTTYND